MSFKPEVIADSGGKWCGTPQRFATKEEAEVQVGQSGQSLASCGRDPRGRVRRPVNYRWQDGQLIAVEK
jgi:hypothetical protein